MKLTTSTVFKILGSFFSIFMIAYVTSKDSDNTTKHKALNTTILVTQALMMLLLFTSELFPTKQFGIFSSVYLLVVWVLLYAISTSCLASRFGAKSTLFLSGAIGNLILMVVSVAAFSPKSKGQTTKAEIKAQQPVKINEEALAEIKELEREDLEKKVQAIESRAKKGNLSPSDRRNIVKYKTELANGWPEEFSSSSPTKSASSPTPQKTKVRPVEEVEIVEL